MRRRSAADQRVLQRPAAAASRACVDSTVQGGPHATIVVAAEEARFRV